MRKWTKEALENVMDANACAQDAMANVVPLFEGIGVGREIDRAEHALRDKIRTLIREMARESDPTKRTLVYQEIKRLWILEDANEAREDLQDRKEARFIGLLKRAVRKIAQAMRKAASALESIIAATRKATTRSA